MFNLFVFSDMRYPHNHSFLNGVLHTKLDGKVCEFGINSLEPSLCIKKNTSSHYSLGIPGSGFLRKIINYFLILFNIVSLVCLIKKHETDVVFVRNDPFFSLIAIFYKKISNNKKIKFIYQLSHLKEEQLLAKERLFLFSRLMVKISRFVRNYVIKSADEVLLISEDMKKIIGSQIRNLMVDRCHIFGLGMSLDWSNPKLKSDDYMLYSVYVGTLDSSRGMDVAINAYIDAYEEELISLPLYVVGGDKNHQDKVNLLSLVAKRNAEHIIFFIPTCDRLECYKYIYNAKFAICTFSDTEVNRTISPTKLFEYLFFNTPVICSLGNSVVETVVNGSGFGVVSAFSRSNIKKDISMINGLSVELKATSIGYDYIMANHNYERMAIRLNSIIVNSICR